MGRGGPHAAAVSPPANTVAPAVTGTATVGQTLTTTNGTWTGSPSFTYQWQRAGVNIGSATASTYVLVDADYTNAIRCVVTGTNAGGNASANSNATAAVVRTYGQEVLADAPNGWWKFNESSGTTVLDYSGNSNTLTWNGTPSAYGVTGPVTGDTAITIASPVRAELANVAKFNLSDIWTTEIWIKRSATIGAIMGLLGRTVASEYELGFGSDDKPRSRLVNAGSQLCTGSGAIGNDSTWHHIVATHSGNGAGASTDKMYVDGVDVTVAGTQATTVDSGGTFRIGRDAGGNALSGTIAHAAIYPTALSAARIALHYSSRTV